MTDPDAPIRTTHVGSLVRPAELVAYLRKIDAGEDYDEQAYQECLARSVRDVVQAQRDAGIDIVSDGEFGKSAWNYYVYRAPRRHRAAPEPAGRRELRQRQRRAHRLDPLPRVLRRVLRARAGIREPGRRLGLRRARDLHRRRGHRARHRQPQGGHGRRRGAGGLPARRRARLLLPEPIDEHYGSEEAALLGIADGAGRGVPGDRRRGPQPPDRRRLHPVHVRRPRAARHDGRLPGWAQPRIAALNHALEGIPQEKVRYHVCWGSWNGPHTNDIALRDVLELMFRSTPAPTSTSTPTRATSTSGASGRTSTCRPARRSPRASSATRPTSSSTPSSWPSASSAPRGWSAPSTSWPARTAASPRARTSSACTRRSSGRSCARSPRGPSSPRAR